MEWKGRRQSSNVEDQRGTSAPGNSGRSPFGRGGFRIPMGTGTRRAGGGMSIGTIIFLVVIYFVFKAMGIDLLQVLGDGSGQVARPGFEQTESANRRTSAAEEERKAFMGDFAQAYVVAHEVGHHVQNLTGVLPRFNQQRRSMSETEANQMSIRVELQADCYAGIWGKFTEQKGLLERGDLQEALNAATQIGDDTLQKRTQGYVVPESFNHGTSEQRRRWFQRGFDSGRVDACDTFSGDV